MVSNQKPTGRALSMPSGLAAGSMVSLLLTLVLCAVLAKLLDMEKIQWDSIGYGIMVMLLVSAVVGAEVACRRIKRQKLLVCVLTGIIYFCMLLGITALFFGGQYEAVGVTAILVLGSSLATGLLEIKEGKGKGRRKQVRRQRKK